MERAEVVAIVREELERSSLAMLVRQLQFALGVDQLTAGVLTLTWGGASIFSNFPTPAHNLKDRQGAAVLPKIVIPVATAGLPGGKRALVTAYGYSTTTFTVDAVTHDSSVPAAGTTVDVVWLAGA